MTLFIMIFVFLAVAALTGGIALMLSARRGTVAEERLHTLAARHPGAGMSMLQDQTASVLAVALNESDPRRQVEQFVGRFVNLKAIVEQAGVPYRPSSIVMAALGMAVAVGMMVAMTNLPIGATPLAALLAVSLPFIWLLLKRRQRLKKFEGQLPEAMELLSRSLRAGHSLGDGIRLIGEEMPEPISGEFSRCYEEQNLGRSLEDTLDELAVRIPNLDVRFFVTSVILQRQTGGDMAEILDKIGRLIRERFQIRAQVKALTGEGRMSGVVLLAMPLLLTVYMYLRDPEYLRPLVEHPLGQRMVIGAVVLQILGAIVIKKIVDIKV
jgi:tight adherence protein B